MRTPLGVLASDLLATGCGHPAAPPPATQAAATGVDIVHASISRIVLEPLPETPEVGPDGRFAVHGTLTVAEGWKLDQGAQLYLLLQPRNLSEDQVRVVIGTPAADGSVPFEARLKWPATPGRFAIEALLSVTPADPNGSMDTPKADELIRSSRLPLEVGKS